MNSGTQVRHHERFDPRAGSGRLIDSEHQVRYRWASRVVAGKDVLDAGCGVGYGIEILAAAGATAVTGVDVDPSAVEEAKQRFGEHAKEICEGNLEELPFADQSFDVVVCFEVIEHVEQAEQALREMRRVLRGDGLLIVSSPNPKVYLGGNEHHIREFQLEELAQLVGESFANVAPYRQDAWVGSTIQTPDGSSEAAETFQTSDSLAGEPSYGIVIAGDGPLPNPAGILAFGDDFDVKWWAEQLAHSKGEAAAALEREMQTRKRLEETATALMEANQSLAQVPLLRHRLAELEQLHGALSEQYHQILSSKSWRLTAPLRRLRRGQPG